MICKVCLKPAGLTSVISDEFCSLPVLNSYPFIILHLFHFFQCEMHWTGKQQDLPGIYFCEMRNGSEAYPTTISNQWTSQLSIDLRVSQV